jgi:hypothetical protein
MADAKKKIEAAIGKLLKRNQKAADKVQKAKGASPDSMQRDLEAELLRRQKFANRKLPNVLKEQKKVKK